MKRLLTGGLIFCALAGCATDKTLIPIGGSRSDGTVELAFDYNMFQKPKVDETVALATARQKCAAWGYQAAEPFGGVLKQCVSFNAYGCAGWRVTVKYQCTGAARPS